MRTESGSGKEGNMNPEKSKPRTRYYVVIAAALAVLIGAAVLSNPSRYASAKTPVIDSAAVSKLEAMESTDVGEVVRAIRSIEASRKAESSRE